MSSFGTILIHCKLLPIGPFCTSSMVSSMALNFLVVFCFMVGHVHGYKTDCSFHKFEGSPGEVIAKFEPTLPGKISMQFGDKSLKIYSRIVSLVPDVGGALSGLYGTIAGLTDNTIENMQTLQKTINDLTSDIRKTVLDLKDYVDAKFDEYDYDKKSDALKSIYDQSGFCAEFSSPSNKETCLKSLIVNLAASYPEFLPTDPKYETFEQILPMTRQFADLHFAVLLDTLLVTKVDSDYKNAIANFSVTSYNYIVHGINTIVDQHLKQIKGVSCKDVGLKQICVPYCISPPCGCMCSSIETYACQQQWANDDGCKVQYPDPPDPSEGNCFEAGFFWPTKAKNKLKGKLGTYKKDLEIAIRKYWGADVGQAMASWKKLGINAGARESSFLPYSLEPSASTESGGGGHFKRIVRKFLDGLIHALGDELKKTTKTNGTTVQTFR